MTKKTFQIEVLLITGTSFLAANWIKKDNNPGDRHLSDIEQLQEACWNGFLKLMLPEVRINPFSGGFLHLWDIKEAESYLELKLSELPLSVNDRESITPHTFLSFQVYS